MDRGAWWAKSMGSERLRHDWAHTHTHDTVISLRCSAESEVTTMGIYQSWCPFLIGGPLQHTESIFLSFYALLERDRLAWLWLSMRALEPGCADSNLALTFISWVTRNAVFIFFKPQFPKPNSGDNNRLQLIGLSWGWKRWAVTGCYCELWLSSFQARRG